VGVVRLIDRHSANAGGHHCHAEFTLLISHVLTSKRGFLPMKGTSDDSLAVAIFFIDTPTPNVHHNYCIYNAAPKRTETGKRIH